MSTADPDIAEELRKLREEVRELKRRNYAILRAVRVIQRATLWERPAAWNAVDAALKGIDW